MKTNKSKKKSVKITKRPHKLSIESPTKTKKTTTKSSFKALKKRMVVFCTEEEEHYIRVFAASKKQTLSDYLLAIPRKKIARARCNLSDCSGLHIPNKETQKVLRDTDTGKNLESHKSLDDFWKAMGVNPDAFN